MPGLYQRAARSAPVCCFSSAPPPNTKIPLRNTPAERYEQKLLTQTNRTNKVAKAATHGPFIRWGGEWTTHKHNTVATLILTVQLTLTFIWLSRLITGFIHFASAGANTRVNAALWSIPVGRWHGTVHADGSHRHTHTRARGFSSLKTHTRTIHRLLPAVRRWVQGYLCQLLLDSETKGRPVL